LERSLTSVRELRDGVGPFAAVLRISCGPEFAPRLPKLVSECVELGFDEVIITPPWQHGLDDAMQVIESVKWTTA
jgi:hypothetical protein